ncbi:HDOD domain-containing protein [Fundidesulfovibrio terrae]|uniref:HDOD domain-containing protein n=1 Tax=Fundidesulfovibrio terrae TaxID=2922866 RepID=UPI001FAF064A
MRVSDLHPGLVLARDVRDVNGRLLISGGTCLNDRFIGVLKAWGVGEVQVEGEKASEPGEAGLEEALAQAEEIMDARLARNDLSHGFVQEVFRLGAARIAAAIERGEPCAPPPVELGEPEPRSESAQVLDLEALTASNPALGAMPEVLARLAQAMENPSASPVEVAGIIQNDPALAAKLLKVANSALYGFPQRIDTISRAVTVIGVQQLSALALGVSVMDMFKDIPRDVLNVRGFWRHCLACACGARALASALGMPNTERIFVSGLLHDVGLLLFILHAPDRFRQVLQLVRERGESLTGAERRVLGVDHGLAGGALLAGWGLPPSLTEATRHHHEPLASPDIRNVAIVHVADFLAEALVAGSGGQSVLMPLHTVAFDMLDAPSGVAGTVVSRVEDQLGQLESIFMQNVSH